MKNVEIKVIKTPIHVNVVKCESDSRDTIHVYVWTVYDCTEIIYVYTLACQHVLHMQSQTACPMHAITESTT